jgi:hypothetical protein
MATTTKIITSDDLATTKTPLHEAVPLTGTIVSGTYGDENIKNYSHGMFQSVYDYPYLSSSANHIFDLTVGYSTKSALSGTTNVVQQDKKFNLYNQFAQVLVGHDITGSILEFDRAGTLTPDTGTKIREAVFVNFSRLLTKDEIKKGTFALTFLTGGNPNLPAGAGGTDYLIKDYNAIITYKANSPAGEYGFLYSGSQATPGTAIGLLYYQAGIAVLTASIFVDSEFGAPASASLDTGSIDTMFTGSNISSSCDGIRNRWKDLAFNNTTELNSTIYFCRVNHSDFNFSSNPTYLSSSQIRVKESSSDDPISYITTVGLYNSEKVLMAVAKLSEPLKKTPRNELTLRVRLDY